ncbi:MAG TPA: fatty acid desaturase [Vicinamibacterales bacterium]|nr:fatty acid desaturase [Vicinamibacterales bacterium]
MTAAAPPPSELRHLRPADAEGTLFVAATLAATAAGVWLSLRTDVLPWAAGQLLLAASLVEWFVLLHECGHRTLFRAPALNVIVGHIAGFFAAIPFGMWVHVHRRHHKWTGWQDLDPTTAALAPRDRTRLERRIVSVCWKYWLPLFSIVYRLGNFWNPARLARLESTHGTRARVAGGLLAVAAIYVAIAWWLGPAMMIRLGGAATLVAFAIEDVLIISQHTHVPMELSGGRRVLPHRALEQARYTRSLRLPGAVSRALLHFDAHELHHMYPFVPGYRLREIAFETAHEVTWWRWVRAARACPGDVLLFQNRRDTGFDI